MITRRYTFKMYPNATQKAALDDMRVMCCRLYNALNEQRHDRWSRFGKAMSAFDQGREMTRLCNDPELPEWHGFPSGIRERISGRIDQAWKKYFSNLKDWRKGKMDRFPLPPRYQKTSLFNGFGLRESGHGWKFLGKKITIAKIGEVRIRGRFPMAPEQIRTADLMIKNGAWYISIVVKTADFRRMSRPRPQNFHPAVVNSLHKIMEMLEVSCGTPGFAGERQVHARKLTALKSCSAPDFAGERQVAADMSGDPVSIGERQAQTRFPQAGTACKTADVSGRRQRRLDYAMHYVTSWMAETGGDICITRPALKKAVKSARGTKDDPGAMVKFKARQTRKLLDLNIGKFCALLEYKVEARDNKFQVIETEDHTAMIPTEIAALAKAGKAARRKRKAA